jgi:hypothetical protein
VGLHERDRSTASGLIDLGAFLIEPEAHLICDIEDKAIATEQSESLCYSDEMATVLTVNKCAEPS